MIDQPPLQIGKSIKIPEGETPHLFLTPEKYLGEDFKLLPPPKIMRSGADRQGRFLSAEIRGHIHTAEDGREVMVVRVKAPTLIARGLARARKRPPQTKIKRIL